MTAFMQSRFSQLSSSELLSGIQFARAEEKRVLMDLLHYLLEIDRRKAHLDWGYSSLFVFLTEGLAYEKASAQRRIEAFLAMRELPEIEPKLSAGSLSLSTISRVRQVLRYEGQSRKVPLEEKRELFQLVENRSLAQADRALAEVKPQAMQALFEAKSSERPLAQGKRELRVVISDELAEKWERLKDLRSHADFDRSPEKLLEWLIELGLEKADPARREARREKKREARRENRRANRQSNAASPTQSLTPAFGSAAEPVQSEGRTLPSSAAEAGPTENQTLARPPEKPRLAPEPESSPPTSYRLTRDQVLVRDQSRCQYLSPHTGRRCESRHALEVDHIHKRSQGGPDRAENLRVYCDAHNRAR